MAAPMFLSPQWADQVGAALRAGPDERARAAKLAEYWDFYQLVRDNYRGSWALNIRGLPTDLGGSSSYLRIEWAGGDVTDSRIVPPGEQVEATYVLDGDYADWKALYHGQDALRMVMYRKLILSDGPLLEFFKGIYFFVESLTLLATVATRFPEDGAPS